MKYSDNKRGSTALRNVALVVCILAFIGSLSLLLKYFYDDYKSGQLNSEIASRLNSDAAASQTASQVTILPKFQSLLNDNQYLAGWIKIDDTPVDYPVVQYSDNDYFLRRDFYGKDDRNGTIFIDYRNSLSPQGKNLMIYGHNMKSTKMFSSLQKYEKLSYYKQHPIIHFDTLTQEADYKIFSIVLVDSSANKTAEDLKIYLDYPTEDFFLDYVQKTRESSFFDIPVEVRGDDQIITLVTCAYDFEDARILIFARKVRDGESSAVEVDKAVVNEDVKMPAAFVE